MSKQVSFNFAYDHSSTGRYEHEIESERIDTSAKPKLIGVHGLERVGLSLACPSLIELLDIAPFFE